MGNNLSLPLEVYLQNYDRGATISVGASCTILQQYVFQDLEQALSDINPIAYIIEIWISGHP